jgi:hypothetical protein
MGKVEFNHDAKNLGEAVPGMDAEKVQIHLTDLMDHTEKFSILTEWIYNNAGDVNTATAIAYVILNSGHFEKVDEPAQDA